ncbi:MAG TPA: DNA polymerase III subunit beta [Dehalococcoidia bacterium]|jgi:DNA polymerase-3 subunit beta|nr:DNA polymerase III subunit beta [Dehalococcoidia bacterium]
MKVSALQDNFSKGLSVVGRAVPARSTLPQASHVLLATDEGRLKLVATDLMMATTCWIGAQVEEEGAVTVPARLLTDFVTSLPNERIDLTVPARGRQLHISCARNEATMAGMDAADFPPLPAVADGLSLTLEPKTLRKAIAQVQFAAAADDTRPVLTGVHTLAEGRELTLAAADGFRLAVHTLPLKQEVPERVEVIVPARALREVERLIAEENEPVEMSINGARSQVLFKLSDVEIVATLIQGTFPNYGQLIPSSYATKTTIDMRQFLQEARIAAIFARDGAGIVRIQLEPGEGSAAGKMTVSARAEEIGEHRGDIDVKVEGEAAKIAFNSKYLQDVLSALDDVSEVALETTSPSSPGVLRPIGNDRYVHVVMPMFVQW